MSLFKRIIFKLFLPIAFLMFLASCSSVSEMKLENPNWDDEMFFIKAKEKRSQGNNDEAIDLFESLEARFPFSEYSLAVPLEIAYTYYKMNDEEMALNQLNRFISNNPNHPNLDYAYYMRGYIFYDKGRGILTKWVDTPEKKDTTPLRQSFDFFKDLIEKFPNSKYATKAGEFFFEIRDILAFHELEIASYYTDRGALVGAISRLNYIIENYQDTSATAETLALLEYNYIQSGLTEEANNTKKVLDLNYPNYTMQYKPK